MIQKKAFVIILTLLLANHGKSQISNPSRSDLKFIKTDDITHFWKAFDLLRNQNLTIDSVRIIKEIFVDSARQKRRISGK